MTRGTGGLFFRKIDLRGGSWYNPPMDRLQNSPTLSPSPEVPLRAPPLASALARARLPLAREIKSYAQLKPDWDGYGGRAPAQVDIDNAVDFLMSLRGGDIPRPMVAGDGDVGFTWRTESAYLEIGFCDEGQISFYGKTPDGGEAWGDNDYAKEGVPAKLRELLESIAHVPEAA